MIQSKFGFNVDVFSKASKVSYKLKSQKKEKFIQIGVPIAFILMICVLIYDIRKDANIVFDIILLALLLVLEVLNLFMPKIIYKTQNKYLKKLEQENFDFYISEYDNGTFKEKLYKDNKVVFINKIEAEKLVNYTIDGNFIILIFNNYATLVFDKNNLVSGTEEELLQIVEKYKNYNLTKRPKTKKR